MRKYFLFLLIAVFIISFASAGGLTKICIDKTPPSAPANLAVSGSVGNIILTWNAATDEPTCSGIDYYVISRDEINLENTTSLNYTDTESLSVGSYNYTVFAVDKVGHNTGSSIKNEIKVVLNNNGNSHNSGGGGTTIFGGEPENSYVCSENWQCGEWEKCENGEQTRTCTDTNSCGTSNGKPATIQECKEETFSSTNFFTGAVTGITDFVKSGAGIATIFVILIVGTGGLVLLRVYKLRKK